MRRRTKIILWVLGIVVLVFVSFYAYLSGFSPELWAQERLEARVKIPILKENFPELPFGEPVHESTVGRIRNNRFYGKVGGTSHWWQVYRWYLVKDAINYPFNQNIGENLVDNGWIPYEGNPSHSNIFDFYGYTYRKDVDGYTLCLSFLIYESEQTLNILEKYNFSASISLDRCFP